jgi:hypothetical protein
VRCVLSDTIAACWQRQASGAWKICQVRPGSHPFHALAAAIAPHIKADHQAPLAHLLADKASLAGLLASREVTLAELVRGNGENKTGRRLLLVLDQFEELYTLCSDPALRQDFIDLLLSVGDAPDDPPLFSVLLAVRADFMGQMLAHRGLADALQDGVIMLGPMNRQELETPSSSLPKPKACACRAAWQHVSSTM